MFYDSSKSATLVAAFIGLAGALAGTAVSWLNTTSSTAQRMRAYQEASCRVNFWDCWLKTLLTTGISTEETTRLQVRVQKELRVAVEYVEAAIRGENERVAYHIDRQKLSRVRQWLLLYRPWRGRTWWAWVAWIMFFLLLIAALVYFVTYFVDRDLISQWSATWALSPYVISPSLIAFAWLSRGIFHLLDKPNWQEREGRYTAIDKLGGTK